MGSLSGKSPSATYKSLLKVSDESNGITTSLAQIEDGEGTSTCMQISDDQIRIKPENDDTTAVLSVFDKDGNALLSVDSSNDQVKVGTTQWYANSNVLDFSAYRLTPVAGTHYFVPCSSGNFQSAAGLIEMANGTGTDPDTTLDAGDQQDDLLSMLFYAPKNLSIDSTTFMVSTASDTDTDVNLHLYKFTMTNAGGTSDGNLSSGTLLAHGLARSVDRNVIKTVTCTSDSTSVSAGEVIACFVENTTNTDNITIRIQTLYHIV